ncbi:hypothetical protein [Agriterribacter sp.]|uniref:hypothetical protein n=1 Tax=Agriterribacter sp. TaxID=2821509 RepID=UPI002CCBB274|nr:hypothetical protein [Agriterribacter sp.]HRO44461.1 hypothetical protein [Agriterribacter sp.]
MKKLIICAACGFLLVSYISGCSPKYGCPANGKSVGAERVLSGEKAPKAKSFKN